MLRFSQVIYCASFTTSRSLFCASSRRLFTTTTQLNQQSKSSPDKNLNSLSPRVQRLQLSPLKWIRNQIILLLLKRIDPVFDFDECTAGATKAAPLFMQALAKENWAALQRMASKQAVEDFKFLVARNTERHERESHPPEIESPWQFTRQVLKFTRSELVAANISLLTITPRSLKSEDNFAGIPLEKDVAQAMEVYFEYNAFFSREIPESMQPKFAELYMKNKKVIPKEWQTKESQKSAMSGIFNAIGLKSGLTMEVPLQFARLYVQRHERREWEPASNWLVHRVPHIRIMPFILPGMPPARDDDAAE